MKYLLIKKYFRLGNRKKLPEGYPILIICNSIQRFSKNKMVVFISARVHPGETPSSYAMRGILNFLLNK
jgi:hypothetical protein